MATTLTPKPDLARSIALVERRIEMRRARLERHALEAAAAARARARPLPLIGVAAMAFAGFLFGHRRPPTPLERVNAAREAATARRTGVQSGLFAVIAAALQAALRFGTHPLVRSVWKSYARRRVDPTTTHDEDLIHGKHVQR